MTDPIDRDLAQRDRWDEDDEAQAERFDDLVLLVALAMEAELAEHEVPLDQLIASAYDWDQYGVAVKARGLMRQETAWVQ
jgi:hypothetical protein